MEITAGTLLVVTTASGEEVPMRATGHPVRGRDFPVVWVCTEDEFQMAEASGKSMEGVPWPLTDVKVASGTGP